MTNTTITPFNFHEQETTTSNPPAMTASEFITQLTQSIDQLTQARNTMQRAVSVEDAMRMLNIKDRHTLMKLARAGHLRLRKIGNRYIVSAQSIDEYLGDRKKNTR